MNFQPHDGTLEGAEALDQADELSRFRQEFQFPSPDSLYFAGHSLGLMPKRTATAINDELQAWGQYGVEGHFKGKYPWMPYHEFVTENLAALVGAKPSEVVAMNTLTVNLHLMMVSFYRPTQKRFKILIENNTFPSDKYAVDSQARFHGFDPAEAVVELCPSPGKMTVDEADLMAQIDELGDSLALVMLGNCNYLSGQQFPMKKIVERAKQNGSNVGFNLAHGAGNLDAQLSSVGADFAVWCSYKYVNSGPGGIAGAFVHERHHSDIDLPRFAGWWGHDKSSRFAMGPDFVPIASVEAWQLSNPPIFQLAALRTSLELFTEAGIANLRKRGDQLTSYLEWVLNTKCTDLVSVQTPSQPGQRGSMLCVKVLRGDAKKFSQLCAEKDVHVDFREPDILRMTPAPLYNSYVDCLKLGEFIQKSLEA